MVELTLADWLAIGGIVVTIIVGAVIFVVQKRLSDKVNKVILDQQDRYAKRKHYHIVRLKANTERIKKGLVTVDEMLDKHMTNPTQDSWGIIKSIVDRNFKQTETSWKTIEYDLAQISELVKDRYLIDKYYDVNIGLTLWTYNWVLEASWSYEPSLQEAKKEIITQLHNLDNTLAAIEAEAKEEP